jgi:phosphoribosylformimino-5-aminoimidazole carboxamide ribotide isomerase
VDEPALAGDFELLPAIDLRGGRVVRLVEGDFARETAYSDDPAAVAAAFAVDGARWLHVVDLDGARTGSPAHEKAIGAIVAAVGGSVGIEVAGGIRTAETARAVLAGGATRIVIGTAALRHPTFAAGLVAEHGPGRVVAAIDVRDGQARGDGWAGDAPGTDAAAAVTSLADAGVTTFEVTAIDRDGLLKGPDLDLLERLVHLARGRVIASGGVSSVDDLRSVTAIGCSGAIVGRALYEGRLTVRDAVEAIDAARASGD